MGENLDVGRMGMAVRSGHLEWQRHALERMVERKISREEVIRILLSGEQIEDYPEDRPFPSALFLGWSAERPLHVVAAFDTGRDTVAVITAYEPSLQSFDSDFRTRRDP